MDWMVWLAASIFAGAIAVITHYARSEGYNDGYANGMRIQSARIHYLFRYFEEGKIDAEDFARYVKTLVEK